ncbi:MAG: succinate dehydrogenase iron-sulfur subunit [Deltaproteobacteria bacterium]|nr:succinate dehydrogenase iron-sulfur subunit [Deltaproteobacteria bacterium]
MTVRVFKIFRYDPTTGEGDRYDRFELNVENEEQTSVLDALFRIRDGEDSTVAFRCACRVGMCGSCAMVINGRERLACKTIIGDLPPGEITVRPLNHFPVVKDLTVDLQPFFEKYRKIQPYFEPKSDMQEPAIIRPDSEERLIISNHTECIACGACVSSCTMAFWDDEYVGPAALNRAFALLADSRDGLGSERLLHALGEHGCFRCHSEFNCTEVCPKEFSPTRAIKYIQMRALKEGLPWKKIPEPGIDEAIETSVSPSKKPRDEEWSRRRFLSRAVQALGGGSAALLTGLLWASTQGPSLVLRERQWVRVGKLSDLAPGQIHNVTISFDVKDGYHTSRVIRPLMVSREAGAGELVVFQSKCPHLGCTVRWDDRKGLFFCACHGGQFYRDGRVKAGPPPRPLDRYQFKVESGELMVLEA